MYGNSKYIIMWQLSLSIDAAMRSFHPMALANTIMSFNNIAKSRIGRKDNSGNASPLKATKAASWNFVDIQLTKQILGST